MVEKLISILPAAVAAEAAQDFCFDCPTPASIFGMLVIVAVMSILFSVPGIFTGMMVHRKLSQFRLLVRLLIVALSVPCFWYLLLTAVAVGDGEGRPVTEALERLFFLGPFLVGGIVLAIIASSLDARRAKAARADGFYSRF